MGQAKQRGSYEQRRALSVANQQQELARRPAPTRSRPLSPKAALFLAASSILISNERDYVHTRTEDGPRSIPGRA